MVKRVTSEQRQKVYSFLKSAEWKRLAAEKWLTSKVKAATGAYEDRLQRAQAVTPKTPKSQTVVRGGSVIRKKPKKVNTTSSPAGYMSPAPMQSIDYSMHQSRRFPKVSVSMKKGITSWAGSVAPTPSFWTNKPKIPAMTWAQKKKKLPSYKIGYM